MKWSAFRQLEIQEVPFTADAVITSAGSGSESPFIAQQLEGIMCDRLIALVPSGEECDSPSTDGDLSRLAYDFHAADTNDPEAVHVLLSGIIESLGKRDLSMVVDYTCMTDAWYAGILRFFSQPLDLDSVELFFACTPTAPPDEATSRQGNSVSPMPEFWTLQIPDRETALVLGLTDDGDRARSIMEYLDPSEVYALCPDPSLPPEHAEAVRKRNRQLIQRIGSQKVLAYPLTDLEGTLASLESLAFDLSERYRVILAPIGPKPLSLLCLLLATLYPDDIDVWRACSTPEKPCPRVPQGPIVTCKITYTAE